MASDIFLKKCICKKYEAKCGDACRGQQELKQRGNRKSAVPQNKHGRVSSSLIFDHTGKYRKDKDCDPKDPENLCKIV